MYEKEMGYAAVGGTLAVAAASGQLGPVLLGAAVGALAKAMVTSAVKASNADVYDDAEAILQRRLRIAASDDEKTMIQDKLKKLRQQREELDEDAETLGWLSGIGGFASPVIGGTAAVVTAAVVKSHRRELPDTGSAGDRTEPEAQASVPAVVASTAAGTNI